MRIPPALVLPGGGVSATHQVGAIACTALASLCRRQWRGYSTRQGLGRLLFFVALLLALALGSNPAVARQEVPERASGLVGEIAFADLPRQARDTVALIQGGGPFPYRKDGSVFQNRERRLPWRPRGYYSEYTVRTPWERDRGARRIVAGKGKTGNSATSGEYFYTDDHYETFRRIVLPATEKVSK